MNTFVGRKRELEILRRELAACDAGAGRFVWVTGRRRLGKSRLVEEFLVRAGVPHIYFQAPRRPRDVALARFVDAVAQSDLPARDLFDAGIAASSWGAALRASVEGAPSEQTVAVVLDELPYLTETDPGFAADLQEVWDRALQKRNVLLIAVGSDLRMMRALTEYPAELHGRPTRELLLPPLSPAEVAQLTSAQPAAAFDVYATVGGFPSLAATWPAGATQAEFLPVALADASTPFVTDALRILDAEFDGELNARAVLEAIGHGERTFGNIAVASGVHTASTLAGALRTLVRKGVVAENVPFAAPPGKKNKRYAVADPYLRFWLRFVGPNIEELDRGRSDLVLARIDRDWAAFRGKAVEPIVQASVERLLVEPVYASALNGARHVGSFWTRDNAVEVDLVGAEDQDPDRVSFIGSIKWRERQRFGPADTDALAAHRAAVPGAGRAKLAGVSRSGFTDAGLDVEIEPEALLAAWG